MSFGPIIIIIDNNVILNTLYLFGVMGRYVTKIKLPITAKSIWIDLKTVDIFADNMIYYIAG